MDAFPKHHKNIPYLGLLWVTLLAILAPTQDQTPDAPSKTSFDKALGTITPELAKEYMTYLASDELEGRNASYPGNHKATEYIAKRFEEAGLKPAGEKDTGGATTFFQEFELNFLGKKVNKKGPHKPRNVIGLLEGSDPGLKEELIVIGAHNDHVGKKGQASPAQVGGTRGEDDIWNGADDNASGSTALLTIVKALGSLDARPKRSILFISFGAEEWGLVGSKAYVRNPSFPIDKHKSMINLDMVGRYTSKGMAADIGKRYFEGDRVHSLIKGLSTKNGVKTQILKGFEYSDRSDQASFRAKNIPSVFFFTWEHADYHKVSDHAEKINYEFLAKIARTAAELAYELAIMESLPAIESKGK